MDLILMEGELTYGSTLRYQVVNKEEGGCVGKFLPKIVQNRKMVWCSTKYCSGGCNKRV